MVLTVLGWYIINLHKYTIFGTSRFIKRNVSSFEEAIFTGLYFILLAVFFYFLYKLFKVKM